MQQYFKVLIDFIRLQPSRLERLEKLGRGSGTAKAECRPALYRIDTANCRMQKQWDKREELLPGDAAAYGRFERETTKSTPKDKRP